MTEPFAPTPSLPAGPGGHAAPPRDAPMGSAAPALGTADPIGEDPSLEGVLAHLSEAGRLLRRLSDHPIRLRRLRAAVWSAITDATEALAALEVLRTAEPAGSPPAEGLRPGDALRRFGTPTGRLAALLDALGTRVCQAVRSDGRPCRGRPMAGTDLCAAHLDTTARERLRRLRLETQHHQLPLDDLGYPYPD